MTSTSQTPPAETAAGSSPVEKPVEAPKEARQVPLDALAESREKAREAVARAEAAEAELARLKSTQQPAAAAQPQSKIDEVASELKNLVAKERKRELTVELGLIDDKQADAVTEIISKYSDLTPTEALELAAKRKPDLFQERGQPGFDPRIHGSMRPRPGAAPQVKESDREKRLTAIRNATGSDRDRLLNNFVGGLAAQAMGWGKDHKKIPI